MKKIKRPKQKLTNRNVKRNFFFDRLSIIANNRLIIAISGGVLVGIIFGLITLQLLSEKPSVDVAEQQEKVNATEGPKQENGITLSETLLDDFYVIQIGLFSDRANAEAQKEQLITKNIDSFIWERDGKYFLLHGIFSKENKAKEKAKKLEKNNIELFVKDWNLKLQDIHVTEEEKEWLEELFTLFSDSIQKERLADTSRWKILFNERANSERIEQVQQTLQSITESNEQATGEMNQLLTMMYAVERYLE